MRRERDKGETDRRTDGREKGVMRNDGISSIWDWWWLTYKRQWQFELMPVPLMPKSLYSSYMKASIIISKP